MFRLAGHLGKTVEDLSCSMSAAEFTEWKQYYKIEPFGTPLLDFWFKHFMSLVHNVFSSKAKRVRPDQYSPPWESVKVAHHRNDNKQSAKSIKNVLMSMVSVKRKPKKKEK